MLLMWCPTLCVCAQVDILQARLCQMLGRSLYIDESTASFYLEDAGGDMKAAMEAFGGCQQACSAVGMQGAFPAAGSRMWHTTGHCFKGLAHFTPLTTCC